MTANAKERSLLGETNQEVALYQPGEKIVFRLQLWEDGEPVSGQTLLWRRTGDDGQTETGKFVSSATEARTITTTLDTPGFVRIEAWAVDDAGKPLLNANKKKVRFDGGAGVAVDELRQGIEEPADFEAFWAKQKSRLAAVPLEYSLTELESKDPEFVLYDVKIDCAGGKPVSGYLTKPKDSAPGSLKARARFPGAGVSSAVPSFIANTMVLSINAHGIENGREPDYYAKLKETELKRYAHDKVKNAKPETAYFNGMMLRVMRALEFLKSQSEWNGKDLISSGSSQGGFQALAGAALDEDVTECIVGCPWACDLGGSSIGRLGSHSFPEYAPGLGYYDGVNMAKRIQCETNIVGGLGDYICPPSGLMVLYNSLKTRKQIEFIQGGTHGSRPQNPQKFVIRED